MQQSVNHSVAPVRDRAASVAFIARASGRPMTEAQKAVAPLAPIFAACAARGLVVTPANREVRLYAVNKVFNQLDGFDWIESFKDLLGNPAAIAVVADFISEGLLTW